MSMFDTTSEPNSATETERRDIDRRQMTRRSEDYFWLERIGEMSNQALMVFDSELKLEFANASSYQMFNLTREEFSTFTCYDDLIEYCMNRGDFGKGLKSTLRTLSSDLKAGARHKSTERQKDLQITTPLGRRLCLRQGYGRDGRMLLAVSDITEEYESKQMLDLAMRVGAAGYWSYNLETDTWELGTKNMIEVFGQERINIAQEKGVTYLMHPDDVDACIMEWRDSIKKKQNWDIKARLIDKNGEVLWCRGYGIPRISENGQLKSIFCYYIDISEEVRLQKEQRLAVKTAQKALKVKNSFLARLSHEVRTPMNAVIGISDALIFHHADPEITPKLELIQNSADKILRIVDETLTHSKLEEGKVSLDPSETSPVKCVENVCQLWEIQAKKNNVNLSYRVDPNLPDTILMDGYRYEQCLNNLISNAVKFAKGGTVQVVLARVSKDERQDNLVLAVKDNGIGMTLEQQKQIFEAYTQADKTISSRFGGTGLGMTITKQITEMMGGTIKVKSAPGKGTVFVIAIPFDKAPSQTVTNSQNITTPASSTLAEHRPVEQSSAHQRNAAPVVSTSPAPQPEPVDSSPLPVAARIDANIERDAESSDTRTQTEEAKEMAVTSQASEKGLKNDLVASMLQKAQPKKTAYSDLRLLVVDDNATNHMVVSSLLDSVVGSITTANDGAEAIETLKSQVFDVVLMDIHMPVMDGIEATLSIRGSNEPYSDVPIIALTADPQYQQKRLCVNIGMDEALAKPVKLAEILAAFDAVLQNRSEDEKNPQQISMSG